MIVLGAILAILGYVLGFSLIMYIGVILLVIGLVLLVAGHAGHAVGGRRHWY